MHVCLHQPQSKYMGKISWLRKKTILKFIYRIWAFFRYCSSHSRLVTPTRRIRIISSVPTLGSRSASAASSAQLKMNNVMIRLSGMQGYILCILIISPPLLRFNFFPRQISLQRIGRPPRDFFWVYSPKRCIFKAFSPFFNVIFLLFLSPISFFYPNS